MFNKLQDMDIRGKKIILRCDFNVPMKDGEILDDTKIKESLETIKYLIDNNCKIIILSHFGKIKTKSDLKRYTLVPIAKRLLKLITHEPDYEQTHVVFSNHTRSTALKDKIDSLRPQEILVVENTRFEDYPSKYESNCDLELAKFWASLGDIYVNDAFASSHRKHASTYGIPQFIPGCIGFLVQDELEAMDKYILHPEKPFSVIMGGAKLEDKIKIIKKLLPVCDNLLLTGGIANSFLKALNLNVGFSLVTKNADLIKEIQELLLQYKEKIVLPFDAVVGSSYDKNYAAHKRIDEISNDDIILDLGNTTIKKYTNIISKSKTVFVNGTAGKYEDPRFANGTKMLLKALADSPTKVIVGGGDSVSAVKNFNHQDDFEYLFTGGGASLEYIANNTLPALEILKKKEENYEVLDI